MIMVMVVVDVEELKERPAFLVFLAKTQVPRYAPPDSEFYVMLVISCCLYML